MNQQFHQEFVLPTEKLLDNLGPGCYVKINQGNGECWVEINYTNGYMFGGTVHPRINGEHCPYQSEVNVLFNRDEIVNLGCDHFCFC